MTSERFNVVSNPLHNSKLNKLIVWLRGLSLHYFVAITALVLPTGMLLAIWHKMMIQFGVKFGSIGRHHACLLNADLSNCSVY